MDIDKLIMLVEERPAIYNITMKEHHNRDFLEKLWDEISNELDVGVSECKLKWNSVRNSYSRYLRQKKKMLGGSGSSKRKKWYLADHMAFLNDYIGQHRPTPSNVFSQSDSENSISIEDEAPIINQSKKPKLASVVGAVAAPMIEYLQSRTNGQSVSKDSTSEFLSSLVPDVNKLTPQRQRHFKQNILSILNDMLDDQEAGAGRYENKML